MTHRRFLALAAVAAMAIGACSGGPGGSAAPSPQASLGAGEGQVNLIIWPGYAERGEAFPEFDWVTPFETATGCKVNTTVMTDSNNGVSLMQSGDYDGGSFSGDATSRLMAGGIVAPVNTALTPNYANIFEGLKNQVHNSLDGVPYGVPHGRGPNLFMYNTDVVTTAPTSWDMVWNGGADGSGKVSVYDSSIYIADAALHLMTTQPALGITNPYQLNDAQFQAAVDLLTKQRDAGALYWGTYTDQVASYDAGDVTTGTSWQFQVNLMSGEGKPIAGVMPDEGSTGWSDTWMIASKAKNPNCMYMWMDHMASAEANGQATVYFGEAPTSQAACDYAETISPGHCELTHATDEAFYDKIWYWTTPQADCADTDAATTCKDQDDWVAAWTTLRGS
ncbi:MAG TPA: extracellular solute-binding protein [Candidatus Saccharimonadales bacterium]|nr:extracellular solute-binding protein [Candidatus Saccharimonadales bacterium]